MASASRKLFRIDLAEMLGIKVDSLQRAKPPRPDGYEIESGHARPWWWESTARAWAGQRPGRGYWRKSAR